MNYEKNYNDYIRYVKTLDRRKNTGYYELHHIKPKSLFPELADLKHYPENGVLLTFREHYLAHYLLTKIYPGKEMWSAFWLLNTKGSFVFSSRLYKYLKEKFLKYLTSEENPFKKLDNRGDKNPMWRKSSYYKCSDEEYAARINKMSISMKGKNTGKRSPETCEKISNSLKGKTAGAKNYRSKPVVCIETGEEFFNFQDAADHLGFSRKIAPKIGLCIRGKRKTTMGFHWRYAA